MSLIHSRLDYGNFIQRDSSSLCLTLQLVWCFGFVAMTTSLTLLQFSTGCVLVDFKVAVRAFLVLHSLAPPYLDQLVRVADFSGRHSLRSSTSHQLHVPAYRLATVDRRSTLVSACCIHPLELPAHSTGYSVVVFSVFFSSTTKDTYFVNFFLF